MTVRPPLSRIDDFAAFLSVDPGEDARWTKALKCELTGRPVGARRWVVDLAKSLGRTLSHETRGRKPRSLVAAEPALELYGN